MQKPFDILKSFGSALQSHSMWVTLYQQLKQPQANFQVFEKSCKFKDFSLREVFLIKVSVCDIRHFVCSQNNKVYLMHFSRILSFSRYLHLEFIKYLFIFYFQIFTLFRILKSSFTYFTIFFLFLIFSCYYLFNLLFILCPNGIESVPLGLGTFQLFLAVSLTVSSNR